WRGGTAVHYVLHYDRFVTSFGVWLREHMTPGLAHGMTWSTLGMEWALSGVGVRLHRVARGHRPVHEPRCLRPRDDRVRAEPAARQRLGRADPLVDPLPPAPAPRVHLANDVAVDRCAA